MSAQVALQPKEQPVDNLSEEALQILRLLDQIENHTAELRKKLTSELKKSAVSVHLKLDNI